MVWNENKPDLSRRNFLRKSSIAVLATGSTVVLGGCNSKSPDVLEPLPTLDRPRALQQTGRYQNSVTVFFDDVPAIQHAEIRYTTDGFEPTREDTLYDPERGITLTKSTTILVRAYRDNEISEIGVYTYLVKHGEPTFSLMAFSDSEIPDIYESGSGQAWVSHFDVLKALMPNPDLIIGAGDLIPDNHKDQGWKHSLLREVLQSNMSRTEMYDTAVSLSYGNHDSYVHEMVENYPHEWFPLPEDIDNYQEHGYYHMEVRDHHVVAYNYLISQTSAAGIAQTAFIKETMDKIKADPSYHGEPIFVHAHGSLPKTVNNGAYSSGQTNIKDILADHPEVIHFNGHSHYTHLEEQSIFQDVVTSLNCASLNYQWVPGNDMIWDHDEVKACVEVPVWSYLLVDVFADRVEIERIVTAADSYTMRQDGVPGIKRPQPEYTDNEVSPVSFRSAGALVGPTWVFEHKDGNVDLEQYNQAYFDRINATPLLFDHNASLDVIESKLRLSFDNIRNSSVRIFHYQIDLIEVNIMGDETSLASHRFCAETLFTPTQPRFDIPLYEVSHLNPSSEYRLTITPRDTALGMHEEGTVTIEFTLNSIENGDFEIL